MNDTTRAAIAAILKSDSTIPKATAEAALRLLDGGDERRPIGRVLRTTEAAKLLGVTTKTCRLYAAAGALESVYVPGNKNRTGYTEASVRALAEGGNRNGGVA